MTEQDERDEGRERPEMRRYVCNTWKGLRIGSRIKFEDGFFQTDDPELQAMIERNDSFPSSIHFQDDPEVVKRKREQEALAKRKAELEAKHRAQADEEKRRDAAAKQRAEDEAKAKKEAEEKKKADDDARAKAAADLKKEQGGHK